MTRDDLRIFCTMFGFAAAVLKDEPDDNRARRAKTIARLIESYCYVTVPDALEATNENLGDESDPASIDRVIDRYKAELLAEESARLPQDRESLLKFYDRLLLRKSRRDQRDFYATGSDDMLANQILQMVEEEIKQDGEE